MRKALKIQYPSNNMYKRKKGAKGKKKKKKIRKTERRAGRREKTKGAKKMVHDAKDPYILPAVTTNSI